MDLTYGLEDFKNQKTEQEQIETLFETYVKEMRFLRNFSERTLIGYREVFKRWKKYAGGIPTKDKLSTFVIGMREAGLNTTTCNISIRAFNAFLTWLKEREVVTDIRLKKLPEEKKKMRVFRDEDIQAILSFKPKGINENRIYPIICTIIDTGLRITECLTIEKDRVDFNNLFITVMGKGKKERVVPMSIELRKVLFRYLTKHRAPKFQSKFFFCTSTGSRITYRNAYRDLEVVFGKVGIDKANIDGFFHSFRRKFARSYLKNGGNLIYLMHAMGHTTLEMTRHYVEVEDEELKQAHQQLSIMSRMRQ